MKETRIALGTWAWGTGMFGGDTIFGSNTDENNLKPVFDAAKERHVLAAAWVMDTVLTPEEITRLETLADAAGIDTRGDWEHTME